METISRVEELYGIIKKAEEELSSIRDSCKHPDQLLGNYSWRPGSFIYGYICKDCGKYIKDYEKNEHTGQ